jgi:hypothetical protein
VLRDNFANQARFVQSVHRATRGPHGRCPIELLQAEIKNSEHVRNRFVIYSETLLSQVQHTVACNSMHTTEERLCRWLLMMHDRAGGEALPCTHEFLSHILGANRNSVTLAAQSMQTAGLISYHRRAIQGAGSSRLGEGVVWMLCDRERALRRVPHPTVDGGPGPQQEPKRPDRKGLSIHSKNLVIDGPLTTCIVISNPE